MFRKACQIAAKFTWPIVISWRTVGGQCSSVIAACVVVNDQGWVVTAGHVLLEINKLATAVAQTLAVQAQIKAIETDTTINRDERRRRLSVIKKPKADAIQNTSVWVGKDRAVLAEGYAMSGIDIGVGRIGDFDPTWVTEYPVFKDPSTDFETGTSLCRLGFPFHRFEPTWNEEQQGFLLPPGAVPLPLFPIDGIFTRIANIMIEPSEPGGALIAPPFPMQMIETSSPGIPGQSGGPIFDTAGRVWGIQSSTSSYALELNTKEKQYFNVGLGIHPSTIFEIFKQNKIKHNVA